MFANDRKKIQYSERMRFAHCATLVRKCQSNYSRLPLKDVKENERKIYLCTPVSRADIAWRYNIPNYDLPDRKSVPLPAVSCSAIMSSSSSASASSLISGSIMSKEERIKQEKGKIVHSFLPLQDHFSFKNNPGLVLSSQSKKPGEPLLSSDLFHVAYSGKISLKAPLTELANPLFLLRQVKDLNHKGSPQSYLGSIIEGYSKNIRTKMKVIPEQILNFLTPMLKQKGSTNFSLHYTYLTPGQVLTAANIGPQYLEQLKAKDQTAHIMNMYIKVLPEKIKDLEALKQQKRITFNLGIFDPTINKWEEFYNWEDFSAYFAEMVFQRALNFGEIMTNFQLIFYKSKNEQHPTDTYPNLRSYGNYIYESKFKPTYHAI
jgi:hypothetical protein